MKKAILYPVLALVITLSLTLAVAIPAMADTSLQLTIEANPTVITSGDTVEITVTVYNDGTYSNGTPSDFIDLEVTLSGPINEVLTDGMYLALGDTESWTRTIQLYSPATFYVHAEGHSLTCNSLWEYDDNVTVGVTCNGGCTLTPGYWKTHSEYGPAPYDDTWAQLADGADTPFFLSGQSYYQVLWTSPKGGNAYYILAHAYIAVELNFLNGADPSAAQAAFNEATALFSSYTPAEIAALKGNNPLRADFLGLATILDDYNNGLIGPGHCSD
jgi:hypothetical protein